MDGIRECTVCGCTHLSDEVVQLRAALEEAHTLLKVQAQLIETSDKRAQQAYHFRLERLSVKLAAAQKGWWDSLITLGIEPEVAERTIVEGMKRHGGGEGE